MKDAYPGYHADLAYQHHMARKNNAFMRLVRSEPVFAVPTQGLWDTYLNSFPAEVRQYYNCHCCRRFIEQYGGMVTVEDSGQLRTVVWLEKGHEDTSKAEEALRLEVERRAIAGAWVSSETDYGVHEKGGWDHLHLTPPTFMVHRSKTVTAGQEAARLNENFRNVLSYIGDTRKDLLQKAADLLSSGVLFRPEKVLPQAQWLLGLYKLPENTLRRAVALAPDGFCHPRASMLGALVESLASGRGEDEAVRLFNKNMDPLAYQRMQAAPKAQNVKRANELFEALDLSSALARRHALVDEIEALWRPKSGVPLRGPFDVEVLTGGRKSLVAIPMTVHKFVRDVLPSARSMKISVPHQSMAFVTITTAAIKGSRGLFHWDNPFAWHYYADPTQARNWGLRAGYQPVSFVSEYPCQWGSSGSTVHGSGVIFGIEGMEDRVSDTSCLFPENLRSDLREVRATIEKYSKSSKLVPISGNKACGLGIAPEKKPSLDLLVTTSAGTKRYLLDRYE